MTSTSTGPSVPLIEAPVRLRLRALSAGVRGEVDARVEVEPLEARGGAVVERLDVGVLEDAVVGVVLDDDGERSTP